MHTRHVVTLLLGVVGAVVATLVFRSEQVAVAEQLTGFPSSFSSGHQLRPYLLGSLFLLPFITAVYYCSVKTVDRYLLGHFLSAYLLSLAGLSMIWVLVDLQDNLSDFQKGPSPLKAMATFYAAQAPAIALILLPNALLFSLLFVLGRMSNSREIISIIQTGRSIPRLILPFLAVGGLSAIICGVFNYHWAPYAEGAKDIILAKTAGREASAATNVARFIPNGRRFWTVNRFPADLSQSQTLSNVTVTVEKPDGAIDYRLQSPSALWDHETRSWTFQKPTIIRHDGPAPQTVGARKQPFSTEWPETPWQLIQPGLEAPSLGVPGLNTWLTTNQDDPWIDKLPYITQWHYRFAQPFICLVTILLAAPLGIVFSRRGAAGATAIAVGLCLGMLLSSNVFLALGEAGYIPPVIAAWGTNVLFLIIALFLLQRRIVGRPIYQTLRKILPEQIDPEPTTAPST